MMPAMQMPMNPMPMNPMMNSMMGNPMMGNPMMNPMMMNPMMMNPMMGMMGMMPIMNPMMMGMMPMMNPMMGGMGMGMMSPMQCKMTCQMDKDGMTCKLSATDGNTQMMQERCAQMMRMMEMGMPCMMMCGPVQMMCTMAPQT